MKQRTHNNLLLLNFIVAEKETDTWVYVKWNDLRRYASRETMLKIIEVVRSNPQAYSDTGINYVITDRNPRVHSIQWSY